jgi:perosamine synthetase
MKVPLCQPALDGSELAQLREVLESGWLSQGPKVALLEKRICEYVSSDFAAATSSGSTALHLALLAAGIGSGDEVILPAFTWVAAAAAIEQVGALPVFCDIDPNTYNIDCDLAAGLVTPNTKALLPVSLFGLPADMVRIDHIAHEHGLVVIDNAACSLGAAIGNSRTGSLADLTCFSFHPRKVITCAEGGMVVGARAFEEKIKSLRNHGVKPDVESPDETTTPWRLPDVDKLGYNYRLSDLHAAVALAQFEKLEDFVAGRRVIASRYNELLSDLDMLVLPQEPSGYRHIYQSYIVRIVPERQDHQSITRAESIRNDVMNRMLQAGIEARPGTHCVPSLSYYRSKYCIAEESYTKSRQAARHTIALPIFVGMTEADVDLVAETVHNCCAQSITHSAEHQTLIPEVHYG